MPQNATPTVSTYKIVVMNPSRQVSVISSGPIGPSGISGEQGPVGPAGPSGISPYITSFQQPELVNNLAVRDSLNPIILRSEASLGSLYWPCVLYVGHLPESANILDNWYMYLSTDHNFGQGNQDGGVVLYTSPSLDGPWTNRGVVYSEPGAGASIETATVLWNEQTNLFHLYHQRYNVLTAGGQGSCLATSPTGYDNWTFVGVILDAGNSEMVSSSGGLHTGYLRPWRVGRRWMGYSLSAGGGAARHVLNYSPNGIDWARDPRVLPSKGAYAGEDLNEEFSLAIPWIGVHPVLYKNRMSAILSTGNAIWIGTLSSDCRRITSPFIKIMEPILSEINIGWEKPLRSVNVIVNNDILHLFYKAGGTNQYNGDIHHATINAGVILS